jgi:hypothetical protein
MTGITVAYNTQGLLQRAYESVRKFHPKMYMIIVDGSDEADPCYAYANSLRSDITEVHQLRRNIGHGRGMHFALERCNTRTALVFDSDIVMLRSPVAVMQKLINDDVYGVGWVYEVGRDGFDYGTYPHHLQTGAIPYLHPYFMLLNVQQYFKYAPFVHHGAPCYKAMIDLHERGLSKQKLINCPLITGHTGGAGKNWQAMPSDYIQHDFGGTRLANRAKGKREIEGGWQR